MHSERYAAGVRVWAPAKVNLYLEVLAKRPDGYHEVATLLVAVSLYDTLDFQGDPAGRLRLACHDAALSTGPDNLALRAAELLRRRTGCRLGAHIRLVKRIPLAAGLAGGSTDAAAALAGLNRLWRLGLAQRDLMDLAAELGSDVAFFFAAPAAWCTGRGEQVAPLSLPRALTFVLICPGQGLSTAAVYAGITPPGQPETGDAIRRALALGDWEEVGRRLHNRLQPAAEKLCPAIADGHARLRSLKPLGALMSGSGSSLFALCRDHGEALRIAREFRAGPAEGSPKVLIVRSCS